MECCSSRWGEADEWIAVFARFARKFYTDILALTFHNIHLRNNTTNRPYPHGCSPSTIQLAEAFACLTLEFMCLMFEINCLASAAKHDIRAVSFPVLRKFYGRCIVLWLSPSHRCHLPPPPPPPSLPPSVVVGRRCCLVYRC